MPIDNAAKMQDRSDKFKKFREITNDFEDLLQKTNVLQFGHDNKKIIIEISNASNNFRFYLGFFKLFAKNLFSGDFWKIVFNAPTIYRIVQNYDKPEMQKLLVEKTSLLEQVGKNNVIVKGLLNDLVFTTSDKSTTLLKQVTGATIDLLHDEKSRNALKIELANNYFKFSLNSFDRQSFIDNFIEYEKSQITNKIKNENDLMKLLKEKSDIRLGDSNNTLKNVTKSLEADADKTEISNALKIQLRKELNFLGLNDDTINIIIPDALVLSLQDAQKILQDNYNEVLNQKIVSIHNQIKNYIQQNGQLTTFDNYISDILREHAQYIVDVQEPLYQEQYIKDYIRFKRENYSTKSVDELRDEAIQYSYNLAPDYMRLTQNVLRIVDSLPDQKTGNIIESANPNLKTVLKTSGGKIIDFVKSSITASVPLHDMLAGFGVTNEILDLAPLVLGEDGGIAKVANLTESIRTKFIFEWVEDALNLLNSNAELQQKFKDNPEMASNLTKCIVNSIPLLKNLCQDLGCTDQVFDIISILVKTPEDTQKILRYLNKGKYVELAQKFIEIAESNQELRDYLTTHKDVYKQLISSLFKEIDLMRDLKDNNGITDEALGKILDRALSILDEPEKFKEFIDLSNQIFNTISKYITDHGLGEFSNLQKEDYIKLTKAILQDEDLFKFLDKNKVALGNFIKFLVEKVPLLKAKKIELLGNVEIDNLVITLIESGIKNRDNVNTILDRYMGDGYKVINLATYVYRSSSIVKNLLVSAPIMNYLSSPSIKGELVALVKEQINSNSSHNSLSELLQASDNTDLVNFGNTSDLSGIIIDNTDFSKIKNIQGFSFIGSNFTKSNFANVEVQNSSFVNTVFQKGVSFAGSELQDVDFSNAKFSGYKTEELYLPKKTKTIGQIEQDTEISFKNAILKNVNFSNISLLKSATYSDTLKIDFEGATIDRSTFNSLVNAIRVNPSLQNDINLRGAKIIGDLGELDLSGINLEGLDLSAVSNLKGTIVKGVNLNDTNINSELLKQALQLEDLQTDLTPDTLDAIKASQKQNKELIVVGKISKLIVNKLISAGKLLVKDAIATTLLIEQLNNKLLTELHSLGESEKEFLYNLFEKNYTNLAQFTIDPNIINHYSDLSHTPQIILSSLYDKAFLGTTLTDQNLADALKYENIKNLIADEIGKKLFGDGQNRGKDFIIIREHLSKVFNQLSPEEKQNLYTSICTTNPDQMVLNASPECEILIKSLKEQYYNTTAGIITSGIYFPTSSILDKFIASNVSKIKVISDLAKINELSEAVGQKIGEKLFGNAMSRSRQADVQKIIAYFNDQIFPHILCQLPKDEKQALLNDINYNKDELVDKLVGNFNKVNMLGMSKVNENSLSQVFYNNTSYTMKGTVIGGIQLNITKLNSQDFFDSVADCVMGKCKSDLSKIEELAQKIGNKLGEKLFGNNASSSRKEDVQKIINILNKVVLPNVISGLSDGQKKENFLKASDDIISSLVGNFTPSGIWGKKITEPLSLAQIFYDNSSYTNVGLISGGIQINDSKLTDKSFLDKIKVRLQTEAILSQKTTSVRQY